MSLTMTTPTTRSKVYAADDMNYTGSRSLLHSTSRADFHAENASPVPSGRLSPMSLRSLPRDVDDLENEPGADIPDIPMRRPLRTPASPGVRASIDVGASSLYAMDEILAGTRDGKTVQGPISPVALQHGRNGLDVHEPSKGTGPPHKTKTSEPDDELMRVDTRSPSTYQRSILSAKSKTQSVSSSSQTNATSLAALQAKAADDDDALEPLHEEEIEPGSFDLVAPAAGDAGLYSLERRSELLFSKAHLQQIFDDPALLHRFTTFLSNSRPASEPLLHYYLDALKAIKAINYSNAIVEALEPLEGHAFTTEADSAVARTINESLTKRADAAFEALARDDLPAYITHVWIQTVSVSIKKRICGTLPLHLRDMSEGLAEVFCLTDPSRHDNPIVFASEEFHRTTQYGMNYVLGRNCRFLQGPKTNPFSVKRIKERLDAGKEHYETFLNYRRDGSPFMNLLMVAPLYDSRGAVRYFIGAQVDVSGLAKDCVGLESLRRIVDEDEEGRQRPDGPGGDGENKESGGGGGGGGGDKGATNGHHLNNNTKTGKREEFRELCGMFNMGELETVRRDGGSLHRLHREEHPTAAPVQQNWHKPRVLIQDEGSVVGSELDRDDHHGGGGGHGHGGASQSDHSSTAAGDGAGAGGAASSGRLTGIYENYLLVRPYPNLKILFASPSLRVPGILQSSFMSKIGGSNRVRDELTAALAEGHGVTARVRWVSKTSGEGRHRWIHCTPLLGGNGAIGVWMVVITDDDDHPVASRRPHREAPPVDSLLTSGTLGGGGRGGGGGGGRGGERYGGGDRYSQGGVSGGRNTGAEYLASERGEYNRGRPAGNGNGNRVGSPRPDSVNDAFHAGTRSSSPYTLRIGED